MASATSDARLNEQHRVLTDLMRPQVGVLSPASDRLAVDRTSWMAPLIRCAAAVSHRRPDVRHSS
jgi:hypothetical protein